MHKLDLILGRVDVLIMETGEIWTYVAMSVRKAILTCAFQHGMNNYNTWGYAQLYKKYAGKVRQSTSGKTAAAKFGGATYSACL